MDDDSVKPKKPTRKNQSQGRRTYKRIRKQKLPSEQIEECPESVHELDQNMSDDEDKPLIKEENSD